MTVTEQTFEQEVAVFLTEHHLIKMPSGQYYTIAVVKLTRAGTPSRPAVDLIFRMRPQPDFGQQQGDVVPEALRHADGQKYTSLLLGLLKKNARTHAKRFTSKDHAEVVAEPVYYYTFKHDVPPQDRLPRFKAFLGDFFRTTAQVAADAQATRDNYARLVAAGATPRNIADEEWVSEPEVRQTATELRAESIRKSRRWSLAFFGFGILSAFGMVCLFYVSRTWLSLPRPWVGSLLAVYTIPTLFFLMWLDRKAYAHVLMERTIADEMGLEPHRARSARRSRPAPSRQAAFLNCRRVMDRVNFSPDSYPALRAVRG